uniref:Uncharacterized protein n=1 Tax=Zooxanthella nutricula TaxID=1333877 RepID=A0A7S2M2K8_9DINO
MAATAAGIKKTGPLWSVSVVVEVAQSRSCGHPSAHGADPVAPPSTAGAAIADTVDVELVVVAVPVDEVLLRVTDVEVLEVVRVVVAVVAVSVKLVVDVMLSVVLDVVEVRVEDVLVDVAVVLVRVAVPDVVEDVVVVCVRVDVVVAQHAAWSTATSQSAPRHPALSAFGTRPRP